MSIKETFENNAAVARSKLRKVNDIEKSLKYTPINSNQLDDIQWIISNYRISLQKDIITAHNKIEHLNKITNK